MATEIDLGAIIDAIVMFPFNEYVFGPDSYLELQPRDQHGDVREWVIDLAMEIADALEPGGTFTASVPRGDSSAAAASHMLGSFVHGIQEAHGASWVDNLEPE